MSLNNLSKTTQLKVDKQGLIHVCVILNSVLYVREWLFFYRVHVPVEQTRHFNKVQILDNIVQSIYSRRNRMIDSS